MGLDAYVPLQPLDVVHEHLLVLLRVLPLGVPADVEDEQLLSVDIPAVAVQHAAVAQVRVQLPLGDVADAGLLPPLEGADDHLGGDLHLVAALLLHVAEEAGNVLVLAQDALQVHRVVLVWKRTRRVQEPICAKDDKLKSHLFQHPGRGP